MSHGSGACGAIVGDAPLHVVPAHCRSPCFPGANRNLRRDLACGRRALASHLTTIWFVATRPGRRRPGGAPGTEPERAQTRWATFFGGRGLRSCRSHATAAFVSRIVGTDRLQVAFRPALPTETILSEHGVWNALPELSPQVPQALEGRYSPNAEIICLGQGGVRLGVLRPVGPPHLRAQLHLVGTARRWAFRRWICSGALASCVKIWVPRPMYAVWRRPRRCGWSYEALRTMQAFHV